MPIDMVRFERLAYLSLALGLAALVVDRSLGLSTQGIALTMVSSAILAGALISAIARLRKNWLRWLFTAFVAIGLVNEALSLSTTLKSGPLMQALSLSTTILDLICVALLFSAASNEWFRRSPVACNGHVCAP